MTKIAGIRDSAVPYPENSPVTRFGSDEQVFFGPHFCVPGQTWHDQWDQYFSEEMMQPQFTFSQQNVDLNLEFFFFFFVILLLLI